MLALLLALSTLTCHDDPLPFEEMGGRLLASVGVDVSSADPLYGTSVATTAGEVPPSDGFFDPAASYLGAVPAENISGANTPWYAGWTVGTLMGGAAVGTIQGTVSSPQRGRLVGVRVRAVFGERSAETDTAGFYTITGVPAGPATVVLSNLPSGCPDPGAQTATVPSGGTVTVDFSVTCSLERPAIPYGFDSPDSAEALLVSPPGNDSVLVLRNYIHIEFDDTTSAATVWAVLAKYEAQVAGGFPLAGVYTVRIPDPGPTYAALDSVLAAIRLEPGVAAAVRYVYREPIRNPARYPLDGSAVQRTDWIGASGSDGTRALRATRAPLAWGCENGAYGGAVPIEIGIIDDLFANVSDLAAMFTDSLPVDTILYPLRSDTISDGYQSHGTAVSGVLTAAGDNGQDVTGILWRSALHLFPLSKETPMGARAVESRGAYLAYHVLPSASAAEIRVLHSSITADADTAMATVLAKRIAGFVNASPEGRLFVQASDNYRGDFTPGQIDAFSSGGLLLQQVAVRLAADPLTRDRFIHVGAANRDGSGLWDDGAYGGATLITGVTEILAPGEDILTLVRPQDFQGATTAVNGHPGGYGGTSFAAPMVSGVAGLLWAFDPTLTAEEVKTYILAGASEQMLPTGTLIPAPEIPASGGLHLLNAYEALARVARERPGTPVCGFPVYARDGGVYFERTPGTAVPLPISGFTPLGQVSVAQGGRLLAVSSDGFFDPAASYLGAVPAENISGANIPWYAGWTVGTLTGGAAVGTIQGTVTSPQRGPLVGVRVRAVFGDRSAATDTAGFYTIPGVPAGPATVVLSSLSLGCTDPGPRTTTVPSAGTAVVDFSVTCDTSRPPVPEGFASPDSAEALLVSPPGQPDLLVLRDFLHIRFDDTTSGPGVRAILAKYDAVVAGGYPQTGVYVVRIPDPGPTYEALDSILAAIAAEPGVANAYRRIKRAPIEQLGRYPTDGPEGQREDWFSAGTDATRALRAIRAPLSWGCETGLYDSSQGKVGVGVVDDVFDAAHLDLASSNIAIQPLVGQILSDALGQYGRSHGTGVVGTIGAHGDNGMGTAGLVWGAELHLFEVAREVNGVTRRVEDVAAHLVNVILPAARAAPIRILHSSISAPADPRIAVDLAWQLERFVNAEPLGRLFVQGAGNDRVTFSPADADTLVKGGWLTQQAVVALAGTVAGDRVLLVSAADRDGDAIWVDDIPGRGTTLWTGVSEILAPGEDILALARTVDFPSGTAVVEGTSFAAPLVSGVAALLWAFDPTLSAELVKHYIVEGARQRLRPDGSLVDSPVIPNSGGLNLLDAYEALAKASRERPGTPVCGFPVYARDGGVYFERTPGTAVPLPISGFTPLGQVSVAQGGRLLAVSSDQGVVQFNHLGQPVGPPLAGVAQRVFLERDTADLLGGTIWWDTLRITHGTGAPATVLDLHGRLAPTFPEFYTFEVTVSPAGDRAGVSGMRLDPDSQAFRWDYGWWLLSVAGAQTDTVASQSVLDTLCGPACWVLESSATMGWALDGQRAVFAVPQGNVDGTVLRTMLANVTFPGDGAPVGATASIPLDGIDMVWPRFGADTSVLVANEVVAGQCRWRARAVANPTNVVLDPGPVPTADCDRGQDARRVFNAPPPAIAAAWQRLPAAVRDAMPRGRVAVP